jgi:hypothetical protein
MMAKMTFERAMESIAKSLRDFGYRDVTAQMISEVYDAWVAGKRGHEELPHGVVGAFAESQIAECAEPLAQLKAVAERADGLRKVEGAK